jgi:hypothetical protein
MIEPCREHLVAAGTPYGVAHRIWVNTSFLLWVSFIEYIVLYIVNFSDKIHTPSTGIVLLRFVAA